MKLDTSIYDDDHAKNVEDITKKLRNIYNSIIRQAAKLGLTVDFDSEGEDVFSFDNFPRIKERIDKLFDEMRESIYTYVLSGIDVEWALSEEKNDYILAEIFAKSKISEDDLSVFKARNEEAKEAFKKRSISGMSLSNRVWNLTKQFKREIELSLSVGIEEGKSADSISRDIRSYLNNPNKLFRRVRDKYGNLKLSKAAAAYHPGQGVYRSSYKNALRLARTEINIAYRSADHEAWKGKPYVLGIEIRLSNNHTLNGEPFVDICDYLAGKYPREFKFTGWHPQCRCNAVPITPTEDEMIDFAKKIANGEDVSKYKFKGQIKEMPDVFKIWYDENYERVQDMKTKPYFITDNADLIESVKKS